MKHYANENHRFKFECRNPECGFISFGNVYVEDAPGPLCKKCEAVMDCVGEVSEEEFENGEPINTCDLCGEYSWEVGRTSGINCKECSRELQKQFEKQRECPNCGSSGRERNNEIKCFNTNCRVESFKTKSRDVRQKAKKELGIEA